MKADKEVYDFIVHELRHYTQYKNELELEKSMCGSSGSCEIKPFNDMRYNLLADKEMQLNKSTAVLSLERRINAIENTLKQLSDVHYSLFKAVFIKGRTDYYEICNELSISYETYKRYKQKIIYGVGSELGLL